MRLASLPRIPRGLIEALALLLPLLVGAWLLRAPLGALDQGLWGPANPWANADFTGNFWCSWRSARLFERGEDWIQALGWPERGIPLAASFPNLLDTWLLAPLFDLDRFFELWNLQAVVHLALNLVALTLLARLGSTGALSGLLGASLYLCSPTVLHELAGGRMSPLMVWPGLLALCALRCASFARSRPASLTLGALGGALLTLQLQAYVFHFIGVVLLALPLLWECRALNRARWLPALLTALGVFAISSFPYLLFLRPGIQALGQIAPPAGFTSLPIAGLLGLGSVSERFQVSPLLLPVLALGLLWRSSRAWSLSALFLLALALGPEPTWKMGTALLHNPLYAILDQIPSLSRMHHPIRLAPFALAAGGLAFVKLVSALRSVQGRRGLPGLLLASVPLSLLWAQGPMRRATSWAISPEPPGLQAARWLAEQAGPYEPGVTSQQPGALIDVLCGDQQGALSLQPSHLRPLLESTRGHREAPGVVSTAHMRARFSLIERIALGTAPEEAELRALREEGFEYFLLVERETTGEPGVARRRAEEALRACCGPAIYCDTEASIFKVLPAAPQESSPAPSLPEEGPKPDALKPPKP